MNRGKDIPTNIFFIERFKEKLEQIKNGDNCWVWKWGKSSTGYGSVSYRYERHQDASRFLAHRVSLFLFKGKLNPDLVVDHICNNRLCVNPQHLQEITMQENISLGFKRNPRIYSADFIPKILREGFCKHNHVITSISDLKNYPYKGRNNYKCRQCLKYSNDFIRREYFFKSSKLQRTGMCRHGHQILSIENVNKQGKCKKCVSNYNEKYNLKYQIKNGVAYHQEYYLKNK